VSGDNFCEAKTAADVDTKIREIYALHLVGRGDEIDGGVLHVDYSDECVKRASLIPWLESRGVTVVWHKK
jgi:hypothetical protein